MATASFELRVNADAQGRTCVTLVDPAGKVHSPMPLSFLGERALYELMQHVRRDVRELDVLERWETPQPIPIEPEDIEEAVNRCGF